MSKYYPPYHSAFTYSSNPTDTDLTKLHILISPINNQNLEDAPRYVYIFVRQDQSREQQLVQAAHVSFSLGAEVGRFGGFRNNEIFVVLGIPNLLDFLEVIEHLDFYDFKYAKFYEPDAGSTLTAVATFPLRKSDIPESFSKYKTLKFTK